VGRVVYLSSAAVYGEDVHNLAINEQTPLKARSYYGLAKIAAEWILQRVVAGTSTSLGLLRPATIYGPGDIPTAYGPSGFLDAAVHGRPITLWGDGSELRELLFIDDVVRLVSEYALMDHSGPLNVVAGRSYTFNDALAAVEAALGEPLQVTSRPRSKVKADNGFDASWVKSLFPT
jgi:UDP-glucose 4-epimerase